MIISEYSLSGHHYSRGYWFECHFVTIRRSFFSFFNHELLTDNKHNGLELNS